jgi:hypothetical protein
MSNEKIESSLDLYIARNVFSKKNVQLVKCYYSPDDGSVSVIANINDCVPNKVMFGMSENFDYPAYQMEEEFPLIEEFYDNYLCVNSKNMIERQSFMKNSQTYDGMHAYAFSPLPRYSQSNDLINEAIKKSIELKLITKEEIMEEVENLIGSKNTFDFMNCSSLNKAKALYVSIINKKSNQKAVLLSA